MSNLDASIVGSRNRTRAPFVRIVRSVSLKSVIGIEANNRFLHSQRFKLDCRSLSQSSVVVRLAQSFPHESAGRGLISLFSHKVHSFFEGWLPDSLNLFPHESGGRGGLSLFSLTKCILFSESFACPQPFTAPTRSNRRKVRVASTIWEFRDRERRDKPAHCADSVPHVVQRSMRGQYGDRLYSPIPGAQRDSRCLAGIPVTSL